MIPLVIVTSVVSSLGYALGLFDMKRDLLKQGKITMISKWDLGVSTGTFTKNADNSITSVCQLPGTINKNFCGFDIYLSENPQHGIDFSRYQYIEVVASLNTPATKPRIRIMFRNYHENYSSPEAGAAELKFNTIKIYPEEANGQYVPLSHFEVEKWWLRENNIDRSDSQLDFSNIHYINVIHSESDVAGEYILHFEKFVIHGTRITLIELLAFNFLLMAVLLISLIKLHSQRMKALAERDTLTGLCNRRGMQRWIDRLNITEKSPLVVGTIYMDIDNFKNVNDSFGHKAGDELLVTFTKTISELMQSLSHIKGKYIFVRMSGDEFTLLFREIDVDVIASIAATIFSEFKTPILLGNRNYFINASMGIANAELTAGQVDELFDRADIAMYSAKLNGKNQYQVFSEKVNKAKLDEKNSGKRLINTIRNNEFSVYYLPIFDAQLKRINSVEIVIDPIDKTTWPGEYAEVKTIAQKNKLQSTLDIWVINHTLEILANNLSLVKRMGIRFAIRILSDRNELLEVTKSVSLSLSQYGIDPHLIELKLNESSLSTKNEHATEIKTELQTISEMGVKITAVGFGNSQISVEVLTQLPVERLNIDINLLTREHIESKHLEPMLNSLVQLAQNFEKQVYASGVTTIQQHEYLCSIGCYQMQGSLLFDKLTFKELLKGLEAQLKPL